MQTYNTSKKRLVVLDCLRGLAALIVLFHHFFKLNDVELKSSLSQVTYSILHSISSINYEAVLFFFVLSGFSIGLSLGNKDLNQKSVRIEYYYRRLRRILPIFLLSLIIAFIVGVFVGNLGSPDYSVTNFLGNILFLQTSSSSTPAWFTPYGFNGPLWSLAFEFFFYLIFPIVYFVTSKNGWLSSLGMILSALFVVAIASLATTKVFFIPYALFLGFFPVWYMGYLVSQYYLFNRDISTAFFVASIFAIVYLLFGSTFIKSDSLIGLSKGVLMSGAFFACLLITKFPKSQIVNFKLPNAVEYIFTELGAGSYAIYALHYPFLLLFLHKGYGMAIQILILFVLVILFIVLEKITLKWNMIFLKRAIEFAGSRLQTSSPRSML